MSKPASDAYASAHAGWGEDLPDWIDALAAACTARSQASVARTFERSAAFVSLVLRRKYTGDMHRAETLVRGALMGATLTCPILGDMSINDCMSWRDRAAKPSLHNPLRVQMYRACKGCKNYIGEKE